MKQALIALALVALCIVGCSKPEARLIGTWSGKLDIPEAERSKDPVGAQLAAGLTFFLELKRDGTYLMTIGPSATSGKWTCKSNSLSLTPDGGSDSGKPSVMTVSSDFQKITATDPSGASTISLELTKSM